MRFLDHIHKAPGYSPAQHLAAEELLLKDLPNGETLRIWEASETVVIVGRSSRIEAEVDLARCEKLEVPVLRRCSGGCAIVAGPGCLMYTVVLDLQLRPELRIIDQAHDYVLQRLVTALSSVCNNPNAGSVARQGLSDLVVVREGTSTRTAGEDLPSHRKFSGNSLRITRDALLYHGTILYDFPVALISELLRQPPREPAYRNRRLHEHFVTNIHVEREPIISCLENAWETIKATTAPSTQSIDALVAEKYALDEWNFRH